MGMTIDEAERYLRLMLSGMKYAVEHWKDRDKEESDIEQTNVEAVESALETMRKYQKIREIIADWKSDGGAFEMSEPYWLRLISEVIADGNDD